MRDCNAPPPGRSRASATSQPVTVGSTTTVGSRLGGGLHVAAGQSVLIAAGG